ncbi:bifunctional adenosylcobinamide kinase/adenosylcobinamide-phosphate guanylyltransferase [Blautia schinkii]|nr:bifunctional adenosylcobinamide kinase/adenosylcobinamide-phosphate guanylyltransferase [Blautia schinkii]
MMVLVTGGSGSGKSAFAETRVLSFGDARRIYIATMFPFDLECRRRIDRHRRMRSGKGFETVERYTNLKDLVLPKDSVVLLECMSNLAANEMFQDGGAHEKTVDEILSGVREVLSQVKHLVIVTNEIFSDGELYEEETRTYQKYLGEINQALAVMADEVVEVVYGIPVYHKGGADA